uniref:host attachment protein n=1 Tax=Ningiella ruwaisensis TaxID=2364274 RepID=UPI0010A0A3FE|nr:host attachment protein [Ningiella ruwaisensis]
MINTNLVLVANGSEAKLYKYEDHGRKLVQIDNVSNAHRKDKDSDIVTDRPGVRSSGAGATNNMDAMTSETSPKEEAKHEFIRTVVDRLEDMRKNPGISSIDLVASPSVLGIVKNEMNDHLMKKIDKTIDKNLVSETPEQILDYLKQIN